MAWCRSDADCAFSSFYCDGHPWPLNAGTCLKKRAGGEPCDGMNDSSCLSGSCACNILGTEQALCAPVPKGGQCCKNSDCESNDCPGGFLGTCA